MKSRNAFTTGMDECEISKIPTEIIITQKYYKKYSNNKEAVVVTTEGISPTSKPIDNIQLRESTYVDIYFDDRYKVSNNFERLPHSHIDREITLLVEKVFIFQNITPTRYQVQRTVQRERHSQPYTRYHLLIVISEIPITPLDLSIQRLFRLLSDIYLPNGIYLSYQMGKKKNLYTPQYPIGGVVPSQFTNSEQQSDLQLKNQRLM